MDDLQRKAIADADYLAEAAANAAADVARTEAQLDLAKRRAAEAMYKLNQHIRAIVAGDGK